jgi:hypothetical protein
MRRAGVVLRDAIRVLGVVMGFGCADAITPNNRPIVTVAGLVTNASQAVPDADVTVRAFTPNNCGTGTSTQQRTGKTNASGIYRLELFSPSTGFSACIRVTVGTTSRDSTVLNLAAFSTVQLNVNLP